MNHKKISFLTCLVIATITLLLDQATKWLALSQLQQGIPVPVMPFFN